MTPTVTPPIMLKKKLNNNYPALYKTYMQPPIPLNQTHIPDKKFNYNTNSPPPSLPLTN